MVSAVELAIIEIREAFSGHEVEVEPDPYGGAYVTVHNLPLGDQCEPPESWIGFLIQYTYPVSDVYPHFAIPGLHRIDGGPLSPAFQQVQWQGRPATQISRRSNRWDPAEDTAVLKLYKVLEYVKEQAR